MNGNISHFNNSLLFLVIVICTIFPGYATAQDKSKGALILVDHQGDVQFIDSLGIQVKKGSIGVGKILPGDHTVITGQGGKIVFLLSNGTLMTLTENTKMKVRTFKQEPFDPAGKKIKDLTGEPSQSKVEIDLDMGSLVVKTKKLNRASSFDIHSPNGTAGIRGTEFQLQSNPGADVQLDVTESTVSFTPPGGGQTMPVSQGNGLSVSSEGVPTPRPVNPVAAQTISATNQAATQLSENISLESVSGAMNETTSEDSQEGDSSTEEGESSDEGGQDPGNKEDIQGGDNTDIKGAALENNSDAIQARKTGKVSEMSKALAKFALNDDQTNRFYVLSPKAQANLLLEEKTVVQRLLSMDGFLAEQADAFFMYSANTRAKILGLDDSAIVPGLNQRIEEALLAGTLSPEHIKLSTKKNTPALSSPMASDYEIRVLSENLKNAGHIGVMEELLELSDGKLTKEWIRTGEVANILLQDYDWASSSLPVPISTNEILGNPFYSPISSLFMELENDRLIFGESQFIGGRNQIIFSNAQSLTPYFAGNSNTLVISSLEKISANDQFIWETPNQNNTRLVLMSGGNMELAKGVSMKSATSDLLLTSRSNINLDQVSLEVAEEIAIRGLQDVELRNVTMSSSAIATIKARRNLNVDGITFSRGVSSILMEATTMRLSNIDFPASSTVRLNSLKGPIDGKYPNFGSNIPASQQVGRVNFISNVSTGGNVMNTKQSFDQFGNNITIGKINRP